jgi:hypothetical protein
MTILKPLVTVTTSLNAHLSKVYLIKGKKLLRETTSVLNKNRD